jgi:alcohol dehydrogenase
LLSDQKKWQEYQKKLQEATFYGQVLFGPGSLDKLGNILKEGMWRARDFRGQKALIVASKGSAKRGHLRRVQDQLRIANIDYCVFSDFSCNPTNSQVQAGLDMFEKEKCGFVVGLGGGSSIDTAKMIASDCNDYKEINVKVMAILTAPGNGAEVNRRAIVFDEREKIKKPGWAPIPTFTIIDPDLMLSVPAIMSAYQGFDALCQCMEDYLSALGEESNSDNSYNSRHLSCSMEAFRLIIKNLPIVVENPNNVKARTEIAYASTLARVRGMPRELCGIRPMVRALASCYPSIPHGANLVLLSGPYYTQLAQRVDREVDVSLRDKMIKLAKILGKEDAQSAKDFPIALENFKKRCNIGLDTLKLSNFIGEKNFNEKDVDTLVKRAREYNPPSVFNKRHGKLFRSSKEEVSLEEEDVAYKNIFREVLGCLPSA